jgi:hypothetical protein
VHLSQVAHRPFLPLGLFIWGAKDETTVERCVVGSQHEGSITQEPIPARYFETGRTLAELEALADKGELELSLEQRHVIEMEVAEVGNSVSVAIKGPFENVCFWGLTYAQRGPRLTQRIEPAEWQRELAEGRGQAQVSGFRGQVIQHHLGGDRVISNVYAPSEESVCRLLAAAGHLERY